SQVRQAPQTVQNVVTYDVVVSADNPNEQLKPGMTATVRIVTASRENVLRVPDQALRYSPGGLGSPGGTGSGGSIVGTAGRGSERPPPRGRRHKPAVAVWGVPDASAR